MKQYESYKDSGTPWIGQIPSHWEVIQLKFTANKANCCFIDGDWIESTDISEEGIRYITTGNVGVLEYKEQGNGFISEDTFERLNCTEVFPGDILISRLNEPIGRSCILPDLDMRVVTSVDNVIFRPNQDQYDKRFLVYYLNCSLFTEHANLEARGSTMHRMSRTMLGHQQTIVPPIAEQNAIAEYLDKKCRSIDKVITTQERRIEMLGELKQSIITEAVTRGINPDAPLKDSGIDWIGKIPEHWEAIPLKFTGSFGNGLTYHTEDVVESDGILVLRSSNIQEGVLDFEDTVFVNSCPEFLMVRPGDIIICSRNGSASLVGKCAMVEEVINATFGAFMMRYRPYQNPKFGFYLIQAALKMYKGLYSTTTINQLTMDVIAQIHVAIPPIAEQTAIAEYLDRKCVRIDSAIAKAKREVELLREFKQSVITEAVTGKIKIC